MKRSPLIPGSHTADSPAYAKTEPMPESKKPQPRMKERDKDLFGALCQHSHFLRSALALAADRHEQLNQTLCRLGHSELPTGDDAFLDVQMETAKEIGGIRTMMYLDAPQEIMKYHFGPLQVALCLLDAVVARYRKLSHDQPAFQDDEFDIWCNERPDFLQRLKAARDSLLHERHDTLVGQTAFVEALREQDSIVSSLLEGAATYEAWLRRLASSLSGAGHG